MGCNQSAVKVQELTSKVWNLLRWIYQLKLRLDDPVSTTDGRFQFVCCTHVNDILYTYIIYIHILCTSIYIIYIYIISDDAWYFLWGPSFLSSSVPLLNGHPAHQAKYTKERHGLGSCYAVMVSEQTKAGFQLLKTDGIPWFLVCWSWRWIGKFKNPTVGIEGLTLSLFLILFLGWLEFGAIYEVNWGVHEICRSFRYYVDKGSGEHSGMALLYDVFPRTFGWPGTPLFLCHNLVWLRTVCEIISSFSVLPWFYMAKLFQANTVNSLEEKLVELQKSRLQIEERGLDFVMLLASGSLSKHLLFT